MKKICYVLLLALVTYTLSSCTALLIGGGGVAAIMGGKVATQDKPVGTAFSDTTIWTKIRTGLANKGIDNVLLGKINIEVNEGRVLLTGTVPDKNKIVTILRVCWDTNGVKEVINELRIGADEQDTFDHLKDSWITAKIKSKFIASKIIKSSNYSVESIDGVVYLFGTAQSQEELDKAIETASGTEKVKQVASYVKVKKPIESKLSETKGIKLEKEHEELAPVVPQEGQVESQYQPWAQDQQAPQPKPAPKSNPSKTNAESSKIFEKDDY